MISTVHFLRADLCALIIVGCLTTTSTLAQTDALLPDTADTREANRQANANGHLKEELKLAGDYMMGRGGVALHLLNILSACIRPESPACPAELGHHVS